MNQDFTDKKAIFVWKKKFVQSVSPEKKIPAQAVGKKKDSCKLKISLPPPPHHFSNGPSLTSWPRKPKLVDESIHIVSCSIIVSRYRYHYIFTTSVLTRQVC